MNLIEKYTSWLTCCVVTILLTTASRTDVHAQGVVPDNVEKAALLALYTATNGENWVISPKWTLEAIDAYPATSLYGVGITNGDITSLSLNNSALSGQLPSELNDLTELEYLIMSDNALQGALPELGALKKLRELNFSSNSFTGTFPAWVCTLTSLRSLNLSSKQNASEYFTGPIPAAISDLQYLQSLYLNYNDFSMDGAIPDAFAALDRLQGMELQGCRLVPASVNSWFNGLVNLRWLNLRGNGGLMSPDGVFPDILLNLPTLSQLNLSNIHFRKLPSRFEQLSNLNYLDLGGNNYSDSARLGDIIDTLQNCPNLETLLLINCQIQRLPDNFSSLDSVKMLYLNNNYNLNPSECEILGDMPSLEQLYLHQCNLSEFPNSLVKLTTLKGLYASYNKLYPVPDTIRFIPHLQELVLSNNGILDLPEWFGTENMDTLSMLVLDNNGLQTLPGNFSLLTGLTYLSIANNQLNVIKPYFAGFTRLQTLILSNNKIDALPDLSTLNVLSRVELQHNLLTGTVPVYLTNVTSLKSYVNISFNDYRDVHPQGHFASAATTVTLHENGFTFFDVLQLKPGAGSYAYAPQDSVDIGREVKAFIGGTLTLVAFVDTAASLNSQFQWFRYVDGVNDIPLFTNPSHNAYRYSLTISAADQGARYYYRITNPGAPALTLKSRLLTLVITCDALPQLVDFNTRKYLCATNFIPQVAYPQGCRTKSYSWNFGDGDASIEKSPLHAYNDGGTYNVTMTIRYSCGVCVRDTTITKPVTFNPSDNGLQDSLVHVTTDVKLKVLSTTAATFADAWPLQHTSASDLNNSFESGSEGVWRNEGTYVYDKPRELSEETDIAADGTFSMEQFNWALADIDAIPHWIKANDVTQYSPFSYELENKDVLGTYSAALYDYGGHLVAANGVNMRYAEMAFTSFEFLDQKSSGNWIFGNQPIPNYYTYNVHSGSRHIAIVEASLSELEDIEKVDVMSRGLFHYVSFRRSRMNFIKDNEIVCRQPYPQNPHWTMIVLRKSPYNGIWKGKIKVKNAIVPVVSPDIDDTFAHSGKSSLKITTAKTFKQDLLQLDSGKRYVLNAWVSIKDPHVTTQKLSDGIGIEMLIRDKNGNVISTYNYTPSGSIIEGWQQIRGSFVCPDERVTLELKFTPGTTGTAWYDDLRLHPEKGNMKSYVYDLKDYRLRAILDEENFASFFYYDKEGNLYLTKKETEDGLKTISENTSYMVERSN